MPSRKSIVKFHLTTPNLTDQGMLTELSQAMEYVYQKENIAEKIAEGKLRKEYFQEMCLLDQEYVKDESQHIFFKF